MEKPNKREEANYGLRLVINPAKEETTPNKILKGGKK